MVACEAVASAHHGVACSRRLIMIFNFGILYVAASLLLLKQGVAWWCFQCAPAGTMKTLECTSALHVDKGTSGEVVDLHVFLASSGDKAQHAKSRQ